MPVAARPKRAAAAAALEKTSKTRTAKRQRREMSEADSSEESQQEDDSDDGLGVVRDDSDSQSSGDEVDMDTTGDFGSPGKKKRKGMAPKRAPKAKVAKGKGRVKATSTASGTAKKRGAGGARKGTTLPKRTVGNKEELNITNDNTLFNSVKDPNTALQSTAEDWIVEYQENAGDALSQLITFFMRCCGCNSEVDEHVAQDLDAILDNLDEIQDAFKKELIPSYPLISKAASYKRFRKSLHEFIERLFASAAEADVLYDDTFLEVYVAWVSAMSSSALRAFRHSATALAIWSVGPLAKTHAELKKDLEGATKAKNAETKKGRSDKARLKELTAKETQLKETDKQVTGAIKDIMDSVYVHRYRDSDANIRTDCINELSAWMKAYPEQFLQATYFKYLGWVLSDIHQDVRAAAIKGLAALYTRSTQLPNSVATFTDLFKTRLVQMAVGDVDLNVRIATIAVLVQIDVHELLDDEQRDVLASHIFDVEPRIRVAVAAFVAGMLDTLVEEQSDQLADAPSGKRSQAATDAYEAEVAKLRLKCLAELLVRFSARLDKINAQENSGQESDAAGVHEETADDLPWTLGGLTEGRIGLAVNALLDAVEGLQRWSPLIELLLYDHSVDRASASTAKAKKGKGSAAARAAAPAVAAEDGEHGPQPGNQVYRLEANEEAVLVEALVAVLSKTAATAAAAGPRKTAANAGSDDEGEDEEDDPVKVLAAMTRDLIPALPKLFAKYRTDAPRIADVLLVPRFMNLELYLETQQLSAFEALWDEISDQFQRHVESVLLANGVSAIARMVEVQSLANINAPKLSALQDTLIAALREPVQGRDVEEAMFDENEVHLLTACTRRMRHLARVVDMVGAIEDDEKGTQTSAWDVLLGLASRGRMSNADEAKLVENCLNVLTLYLMWKTMSVVKTQEEGPDKDEAIEALLDKRTTLLDLMTSFVAGTEDHVIPSVQQEAFKHTLDVFIMHGSMAAADAAQAHAETEAQKKAEALGADADAPASAPASKPKLPERLRLDCTSEVQHRYAGFLQSEMERYVDELAQTKASSLAGSDDEEDEEQNADEDNEGESDSDAGSDDEENATAPRKKKSKKSKTAAKAGRKGTSSATVPARPTQAFLQKQHALSHIFSHFIMAIRLGMFDVQQAASLLAHHGRLGHLFDSASRILIDTLREECVYAGISRADAACRVLLDALKQSFELYERDAGEAGEANFVGLARALSSALVVRGAHLAVSRAIPSASLLMLHEEGNAYVIRKAARAERASNATAKARALIFYKGLSQLLPSANGRDAIKIKSAMDRLLEEEKIEVPPSAKAWEPQRSYEKRLVNIAAKSTQLAKAAAHKPASARKSAAGPAAAQEGTPESHEGHDDVEGVEQEVGAPASAARPRPRPRAKASNKRAATDDLLDVDLNEESVSRADSEHHGSDGPGGLLDVTMDDAELREKEGEAQPSHSASGSARKKRRQA